MKIRSSILKEYVPFLGPEKQGDNEASPTYPYDSAEVKSILDRERAAFELGSMVRHTYDTLLAPEKPVEITPYHLLGDSLDKLEHADLSPYEERIVRGIAEYDAWQLASAVLPTETEARNADAQPDPDEQTLPSLKELLLIARACDNLQDPELQHILYALVEQDGINPEFRQAVQLSIQTGEPIHKEYHHIIASSGEKIDNQADDAQKRVVTWMRQAADHPVPHLERLARKKTGTDESGTGFIM